MPKRNATDRPRSAPEAGFGAGWLVGLQHATFGASLVTHLTWIVPGTIAGNTIVTASSAAEATLKRWAIVAIVAISVTGLGALVYTSFSPLADVLGKDIPDLFRAVQEKGRRS